MAHFLEMFFNLNVKENFFYVRRVLQDAANELKPFDVDLKEYSYETFIEDKFSKLFD